MNEILKKLESNGYESYIIGGYVRDLILNIQSFDIDICTSASVEDIEALFKGLGKVDKKYFSFHMKHNEYDIDITSFREELEYIDNKPTKLKYAKDLYTDLLRRDFTINTIAMDINGKLIDLLGGIDDINKKLIKTVGNTYEKLNEDNTRILRSLRFMSELGFSLDREIINYIVDYKDQIKKINYVRKKNELDKIFSSIYKDKFFEFLDKYDLKSSFDFNYDKIKLSDNYLVIWAQVNPLLYPFSRDEKKTVKIINELIKRSITKYDIYKYGYDLVNSINEIKEIKINISKYYDELPIKSVFDINISINEVKRFVSESNITKVIKHLEQSIIEGKVKNNNESLIEEIKKWSNE